jgi:hypothetical protein
MTSPSAALTWEIWRRHGKRLLAALALLFAFILFYPKLCTIFGVDLDAPNAPDQIASMFPIRFAHSSPLFRVFQVLIMLCILLGPLACMIVTLLCLIGIFACIELDSKKGFAFPARLFTLPISTPFLAGWYLAVGAGSVTLVYLAWTRLVHLPPIDVFEGYPNLLAWVTLMVMTQGIVWSLDAFPITRILFLGAALFGFGFLTGPALPEHPFLQRNQTAILLAILASGCAAAFTGLGKIRHGAWQRWTWPWRRSTSQPPEMPQGFGLRQSSGALAGTPVGFHSPARAQFWFEWHSHARKLVLYNCGLSVLPLLFMALVAADMGILSEDDTLGLSLYLLAVPLFLHFFQGISPGRMPPVFITTRPLTDGELVMAKLKVAAVSTALSWIVTLAMVSVVPLLGDVPAMIQHIPLVAGHRPLLRPLLPAIVLGLMVFTWRFVAADLCFGLTRKSWASKVPVLKFYATLALVGLIFWLGNDAALQRTLSRMLPFLLAFVVILKLFLAQWSFRVSISKRVLARSAVLKYVAIWTVLAAALLVPTAIVLRHESWMPSLSLGIILALPLARVGFCPTALAMERHR